MPDNLKLVVTTEYFSSQELSQQVYFQTDFMRVTLLSHDNLPKGGRAHCLWTDYSLFILRCIKSEGEIEKLQAKLVEMKKKLDNTTAAMQELGRENQSLQVSFDLKQTCYSLCGSCQNYKFASYLWWVIFPQ